MTRVSFMRDAVAAAPSAPFSGLARGLDFVIAIDVDNARLSWRITENGAAPDDGPSDIVIAASDATWERACTAPPPPIFNAFTAVQLKNTAFTISGDALLIAQARPALEAFWSALTGAAKIAMPKSASLEAVQGRYARVALADGRSTDIYYEENGTGTPLLCLHTAGADSRQFHGQISDGEFAKRWRMIAFDLPAHGRSMPAVNPFTSRYVLTANDYVSWVSAFIAQVVKTKVVLMGCSMGAAMTLCMAARHPEQVAGVVALEAPLRARGRRNPHLADARINQGGHAASYVSGLMSPSSPTDQRARAAWIYAQGGPGIYDGDLVFYSEEFDGEEEAKKIDGTRIPVAFLTGNYDYSASPADSQAVAAHIVGHYFKEMQGLGHFPMAEYPQGFRPYLEGALDFVAARLKDRV